MQVRVTEVRQRSSLATTGHRIARRRAAKVSPDDATDVFAGNGNATTHAQKSSSTTTGARTVATAGRAALWPAVLDRYTVRPPTSTESLQLNAPASREYRTFTPMDICPSGNRHRGHLLPLPDPNPNGTLNPNRHLVCKP